MNNILNLSRLTLLLKRFFIENRQRELTFWGIAIFVFTLFNLMGSSSKMSSVEIFMFISGLIFAAKTFKAFDNSASGMHYLLIPATQLEKLTVAILLSTIYFFVMTMITYIVGTVFGVTIGNLLFDSHNPIQFELFSTAPEIVIGGQAIQDSSFSLWETFVSFAIVQSIFMLGSIYFKGNAVGKTMLSLFTISLVLLIIEIFLLKMTFGSYHIDGQNITLSLAGNVSLFDGMLVGGKIVKLLLIPFFWTVAYYRLTEKEV